MRSENQISEEKKELIEKYKHVDGEKVLFPASYLIDENVSVGDKLVWDGSNVKKVEILDPERREKYYRVIGVDDSVEFDDWACYANLKLTGKYNFDELK